MTSAALAPDRIQLGLTLQGAQDRDLVADRLGFISGLDAYRLAVAVALAKNLPATEQNVTRTNAYSVSSIDQDGILRAAILTLREDHERRPYALMERLAEAGLRDLATHLDRGLTIRAYLRALVPEKATADSEDDQLQGD
jgi:hypothetical protein